MHSRVQPTLSAAALQEPVSNWSNWFYIHHKLKVIRYESRIIYLFGYQTGWTGLCLYQSHQSWRRSSISCLVWSPAAGQQQLSRPQTRVSRQPPGARRGLGDRDNGFAAQDKINNKVHTESRHQNLLISSQTFLYLFFSQWSVDYEQHEGSKILQMCKSGTLAVLKAKSIHLESRQIHGDQEILANRIRYIFNKHMI